MKITKLTEEQEARFPEFVEKWVKIGLSTEPADFEKATEAALKAYKFCNLEKPMVILTTGSPYAASIGGAYACILLKELFGKQVASQVRSQVASQVRSQVASQVRSQVYSQPLQAAKVGVNNYGINSFWSSWGAYISFFRDVCGWENEVLERFEIDEALMQSCGWTWWNENVLAISDRPEWIKLDANGRLHSQDGHAIHYRDGWGFSMWHGVAIPDEWLTGKILTADEAITWMNIEQRRAACEIIGWANVLKTLDAKVIDKNEREYIGTLYEANIPDSEKERFLQVKCGTGRDFCLPVPRDVKSALEANSWTYGLSPDQFNVEVRT